MKFSYTILPDQRLSILRFRGSVSVKDIAEATHAFWSDQRYHPAYNGIACLEGVTTRARVADLRELLRLLEARNTSIGTWAAICTEPRPTTLAMMFKAAFTGTIRLEIVSSWEAACRFLQVELPKEALAV